MNNSNSDFRQRGKLVLSRCGAIARMTICNSARRNAMTRSMWARIPTLFQALDADKDIRVVVITGEGAQAQRLGLLHEVWPAADLAEHTGRLCREISALAPLSIAAAKRSIRSVLAPGDLEYKRRADAAVSVCANSADYAEGVAAFMEKRPAKFLGA